ncbi:hypothetical protein J463_1494 [Acinetobacter baumannii 1043794]|nr:hypothetical protein J463_1494 [Acinetobacter baumannii 1043794]EXD90176.1 hypothetical protein J462_2473 [Acinetobacter baumannii 972082]EXE94578.1 hypothetical protein J593_2364 [Acinetobacter baumannii 232184]EXF08768.1 hypothetical protein J600_1777 [Acinetobacter baumannii 268680]EXG99075.1 hypothetical protein J649_2348 [Acinetobacter baumannii 1064293_45]EYT21993.1 hypothetical protein J592_00772 [Acinetobacter baumannii 655378]
MAAQNTYLATTSLKGKQGLYGEYLNNPLTEQSTTWIK